MGSPTPPCAVSVLPTAEAHWQWEPLLWASVSASRDTADLAEQQTVLVSSTVASNLNHRSLVVSGYIHRLECGSLAVAVNSSTLPSNSLDQLISTFAPTLLINNAIVSM